MTLHDTYHEQPIHFHSTPKPIRRFYAVPDPASPELLTFWSQFGDGPLKPWPRRVSYWPFSAERHAQPARAFRQHLQRVQQYLRQIEQTIADDPDGCAARFARSVSHCSWCRRILRAPTSKVYGLGPECRRGLSPEILTAHIELARRARRSHELRVWMGNLSVTQAVA